jgi:RHS repeat-associated protein
LDAISSSHAPAINYESRIPNLVSAPQLGSASILDSQGQSEIYTRYEYTKDHHELTSKDGRQYPGVLKAIYRNGQMVRSFDYYIQNDNAIFGVDPHKKIETAPRLKSVTVGKNTMTTRFHYGKFDIARPVPDDLETPYGWVHVERNGAWDTIVCNRRLQPIEYRRNFGSDRPDQVDQPFEVCTHTDPINCDGLKWRYFPSLDGNPVEIIEPTGVRNQYQRRLDTELGVEQYRTSLNNSQTDHQTIYEWRLNAWKRNWIHRQHWDSIVSHVRSSDNDCSSADSDTTVSQTTEYQFEPVFNQILKTVVRAQTCGGEEERLDRIYSYDYLEQGQTLDGDRFLELTGWSYASDEVTLPGSWDVPTNQCPSGDLSWSTQVGNLACEGKPATTGLEMSNGRAAAFALYHYDDYGRQTRIEDFDGHVTVQEYGCIDTPDSDSISRSCHDRPDQHHAVKTQRIGRQNTGGSIDSFYVFDPRGNNVRKVLFDGIGGQVVTRFERDLFGRITEIRTQNTEGDLRVENYEHDSYGNVLWTETLGSPDTKNRAGTELSRAQGYDELGRQTWECQEVKTGEWTCVYNEYNPDGLLFTATTYEKCQVTGTIGSTGKGEPSCSDIVKTMVRRYNGLLDVALEAEMSREGQMRSRRLLYDAAGRLIGQTNPDSDGDGNPEWLSFKYDSLGRVISQMDDQVFTSYVLNGFDQKIEETRWTVAPDASSGGSFNPSGVFIPDMGAVGDSLADLLTRNEFYYDERGVLVATMAEQFTLGSSGSSAAERWTFTNHDQSDREIEVLTELDNRVLITARELDNWGRTVREVNGSAGTDTTLELDHFGRVLVKKVENISTDAGANLTTATAFQYGVDDKVTRTARSTPSKVWICVQGELMGDPSCQLVMSQFDAYGHLVRTTDARAQVTRYERDGRGNPVMIVEEDVNAAGEDIIVDVQYDGMGNAIEREDSKDTPTTYEYNGFGELTQLTLPNGYTKTFTRNGDGAVTAERHAKDNFNVLIQKTLDSKNRPLYVTVNGELAQEFTYNGNGQIIRAEDHNIGLDRDIVETPKVVVNREWDSLGNLVKDQVDDRFVRATFLGSQLLRYNSSTGSQVSISYDHTTTIDGATYDSSLPTMVSGGGPDGLSLRATYSWTGSRLGSRTIMAPNGDLTRRQSYDIFGNLASRRSAVGQLSIAGFDYDYNPNNRLIAEHSRVEANFSDVDYELDNLDRVVGFADGRGEDNFTLDVTNNITQVESSRSGTDETSTFTMSEDGLHAIASISSDQGLASDFIYDDRGNMLQSVEVRNGQRETRTLTWDDQGRLTTVLRRHGVEAVEDTEVHYKYDALGRRVEKVLGARVYEVAGTSPMGIPIYNIYFELSEIAEMTYYRDNVVSELHQAQNEEGRDFGLVIHHDPTATDSYLGVDLYTPKNGEWSQENSYHLISDVRNNVIGAVSKARNSVFKVEYDLQGNAQYCHAEGTRWVCEDEIYRPAGNPLGMTAAFTYGFSGRRYDEESDLYYYRTRYYAPEMGRFISLDTIGIWGDMNNFGNGYAYVGNMGNSLLDPTGKFNFWVELVNALFPQQSSEPKEQNVDVKADNEQVAQALIIADSNGVSIDLNRALGKKYGTASDVEGPDPGGAGTDPDDDVPGTIKDQSGSDVDGDVVKDVDRYEFDIDEDSIETVRGYVVSMKDENGSILCKGAQSCMDWMRDNPGYAPNMPAPDSSGVMGVREIRDLILSRRLKPKRDKKKITPEYDHWEAYLLYLASGQAEKPESPIIVTDDGRIRLKPNVSVDKPNYEQILKFRNPGCVDPLPSHVQAAQAIQQ